MGEIKAWAHRNYELARALHIFDASAKNLSTDDITAAAKAIETGRIENAELRGGDFAAGPLLDILVQPSAAKLARLSLVETGFCELPLPLASSSPGGALASIMELTLASQPVLSVKELELFSRLKTLTVIDAEESRVTSGRFLTADAVAHLEQCGISLRFRFFGAAEMWHAGLPLPAGKEEEAEEMRASYLDVAACFALFLSAGGHGWIKSSGWLDSGDFGTWDGLELDEQRRLTILKLDANRLSGMCCLLSISLLPNRV